MAIDHLAVGKGAVGKLPEFLAIVFRQSISGLQMRPLTL